MSLGIWQIALIVLIVLLVFGAGKLPSVMGDLAKGVKSFKKGLQDEEDEKPAKQISRSESAEEVKAKTKDSESA